MMKECRDRNDRIRLPQPQLLAPTLGKRRFRRSPKEPLKGGDPEGESQNEQETCGRAMWPGPEAAHSARERLAGGGP